MKIATLYDKKGEDQLLRLDIKKLRDAHNNSESIIELETRTADPVVIEGTGKISIWYRSDLIELRWNYNGTVYKVAGVAA